MEVLFVVVFNESATGCLLGKIMGCLALNGIHASLRRPPTQITPSWRNGLNLRSGLAYPMQFSLPLRNLRSEELLVGSRAILCKMTSSLGNASRWITFTISFVALAISLTVKHPLAYFSVGSLLIRVRKWSLKRNNQATDVWSLQRGITWD